MLCILILVILINFFFYHISNLVFTLLYWPLSNFNLLAFRKEFIIVLGLEVVRISMLKGPLIDASHLINRTCIYRIIN